jgi:DNA-binding transcriptional LysR family regulator
MQIKIKINIFHDSKKMSIQKYKAFIKTAEYKSLTKAAKDLGCTQSAVSHMLSDLESQWGIVLFERSRLGVRITADGFKVLSFAKEICDADERLHIQVEELNGLGSGLIRIGAFSSVATHWLPTIIKIFQRDYPKVDFELLIGEYNEIENWVIEGRVDCGFLRLPTKVGLESIFLGQDKLMVILPQNHPLAECETFPIDALNREVFILLEKNAESEITKIFEKHHLAPNIHLSTWDDYTIMSMVEQGIGISILPELILKRVPYNIIKKELEVAAYRKIGFVIKDSRTASLALKQFIGYLQYRNNP